MSFPFVLVRGAGDLATGTIVKLHKSGIKVLAVECANPSAIRRQAALCEAVYDGSATVEGVICRKIDNINETVELLKRRVNENEIIIDQLKVRIEKLENKK